MRNWHSDQSYDVLPSRATIVTAVELPLEGGSTLFKDTYAAYESMPTDLKQRIAGKRGTFGYVAGRKHPARGHLSADAAGADFVTHPLARTVPMTDTGMAIAIIDVARESLRNPYSTIIARMPPKIAAVVTSLIAEAMNFD